MAVQVQAKPTATTTLEYLVLSTGSLERVAVTVHNGLRKDKDKMTQVCGLYIWESWCVSLRFVESYWHSKSICRIGTCLFVYLTTLVVLSSSLESATCYRYPIYRDSVCVTPVIMVHQWHITYEYFV